MFTGLVEALGTIQELENDQGMLRIGVTVSKDDAYPAELGDSIAINGCCLTVSKIVAAKHFEFEISHETLDKTNLGQLQAQQTVNMERAMRMGDRLGGHLVLGHVDGKAKVSKVEKRPDGWDVLVHVPTALARYLVDKGSVCLDGVSLTINELSDHDSYSEIRLTLIPVTLEETTFSKLQAGQELNIEVDVLGKHLERLNKFSKH